MDQIAHPRPDPFVDDGEIVAAPQRIERPCAADAGRACDFVPIGRFIDRSGLIGEVNVEQCRRCGLGASLPRLADVAFLYADRSSQDFQPDALGLATFIKRVAFRRQARRLVRDAGGVSGRILDYGCGSGLFTRCLAEIVPMDADVVATDFHDTPPADLGTVRYVPRNRRDALRGSAGLVIALHVVEHDDDPDALVAEIVSFAAPGGTVLIEVPNVDCIWTHIFGRYWDAWYLPYHRLHFSQASLRALIERHGLEVVRESGVSVPTMGRSVANVLRRRNGVSFILLGALLHPLQWGLERLTRRPSALRIVARVLK